LNNEIDTGFFKGIDFLNSDLEEDELEELKLKMNNEILNEDTNTIVFMNQEMNNSILQLIIQIYELYYYIPFPKISKPVKGNCLEENLPIEWVNLIRPYDFNVIINNDDIQQSTYNKTMLQFIEVTKFLCCDKMVELFACFMACPEGLIGRSLTELRIIFQNFDEMENDEEEELE